MFKNVAAKFMVFAFDSTTNLPKTGDAANITAYVSKDYGAVTVLADTSATEMDATNAKGYYLFDAAQGETNGDELMVSAKSSTANIVVVGAPAVIFTRPTTGWLAPTTAGRTLDVSAGGEAGVDWANVGSPTTSLALTGTTIATTQKVDIETIKTNPVVNGGTITFPTTATLASTTNITAGTVTTATNVTTVNGLAANVITATSINADAITAAKIADGAIDRATFAADTGLQTIRSNTAQAGAGTTITLDASASAVDNFYRGDVIYLTGATGAGQFRICTGYVGATKVATIAPAWVTNPDATSTFAVLPAGSVNLEAIQSAAVSTSTAQLGVNTVQAGATAWGSGAITAASIASNAITAAKVATDAIGAAQLAADAVTEIQSGLATSAALATVQADTDDIQTRIPAALVSGRIDASVGAMAANVVTAAAVAADAIGASELAADAVAEIVTGVLTTQMTESYAADGAAPTLAQGIFALQQFQQEKSISSTTMTVKKLDGSTSAMTFTLDSATVPSSITRAT